MQNEDKFQQKASNFSMHQNHLEGLLKITAGSTPHAPQSFWFSNSGKGSEILLMLQIWGAQFDTHSVIVLD